jgi:hypothetical protein
VNCCEFFLGVGWGWGWGGVGVGGGLSIDCSLVGRVRLGLVWLSGGFSGPKLRFVLGCEVVSSLMRDLLLSIGLMPEILGLRSDPQFAKKFESPNSKS